MCRFLEIVIECLKIYQPENKWITTLLRIYLGKRLLTLHSIHLITYYADTTPLLLKATLFYSTLHLPQLKLGDTLQRTMDTQVFLTATIPLSPYSHERHARSTSVFVVHSKFIAIWYFVGDGRYYTGGTMVSAAWQWLWPEQNGRHLSADIFKGISLNANHWLLMKINPIENKSAFVYR